VKKYKLSFLPLFEQDLNEIVDYITVNLQNPCAAERLVDDIEAAVYKRLETPAFCAARRSLMRYQRSDGVPAVGPRSGLLASCDCHVVVFCHPLEKRV